MSFFEIGNSFNLTRFTFILNFIFPQEFDAEYYFMLYFNIKGGTVE